MLKLRKQEKIIDGRLMPKERKTAFFKKTEKINNPIHKRNDQAERKK